MDTNVLIGKYLINWKLGKGYMVRFENDDTKKRIYVYIQYEDGEQTVKYRFPDSVLIPKQFYQGGYVIEKIKNSYVQDCNNEYHDINNIHETTFFCKKCGKSFVLSTQEQTELIKKGCLVTLCKACAIREKNLERIRNTPTNVIKSLMFNSMPKSSKKRYYHDTDGMSVSC